MNKEVRRIAFESIALRAISRQWTLYAGRFRWVSRMTKPAFKLHDGRSKLGFWDATNRTISLARHQVYERSWHETVEVLKHEMAHQYVAEVLKVTDEKPHGPTFQSVCAEYDIDATRTGEVDSHENESAAPNHIVEKIRRLLAMAEGRANAGEANAHEAESAAKAARTLMLKYNIELRADGQEKKYTERHVGVPVCRIQAYQSRIANLLTEHYSVEIIWMPAINPRNGKSAYELQIVGTPENVEVAEYVHGFLSRAAESAWERTMASPEFRARRDDHSFGTPGSRAGYTVSARKSFMAGVVRGFASTLQQSREEDEQAGLVLATDPGLADHFKKLHPKVVRSGGSRGGNRFWGEAGNVEGRGLNIPAAARAANHVPLLGKGTP